MVPLTESWLLSWPCSMVDDEVHIMAMECSEWCILAWMVHFFKTHDLCHVLFAQTLSQTYYIRFAFHVRNTVWVWGFCVMQLFQFLFYWTTADYTLFLAKRWCTWCRLDERKNGLVSLWGFKTRLPNLSPPVSLVDRSCLKPQLCVSSECRTHYLLCSTVPCFVLLCSDYI